MVVTRAAAAGPQEATPEQSSEPGQQLAMQLTNPIADLVSVPFQFN